MTSLTRTKMGRTVSAVLACVLAAPAQAVGAGLSSVAVPAVAPPSAVAKQPSAAPVKPPPVTAAPLPAVAPAPGAGKAAAVSISAPAPPAVAKRAPAISIPAPAPSVAAPVPYAPSASVSTPEAATRRMPSLAPAASAFSRASASAKTIVRGAPALPGSSRTARGAARQGQAPSSGAGAGSSVGAAPASTSSPGGGSREPAALTSHALSHLTRQERPRALALRRTVQRLQGCLGSLPERLRRVLELSTGIGAPYALSRAEVARDLHLGAQQVPRLQRRALRRLRMAAHAHRCQATQKTPSTALIAGGAAARATVAGAGGSPRGGVAAFHASKSPSSTRSDPSLLGITPPVAGSPLLTILVGLAGMLLVGLAVADGLGRGPRHRVARRSRARRLP